MKINGSNYKTIWFDSKNKVVQIIDQTLLPFQFKIVTLSSFESVVVAIKTMQVRGAPLIGATAAYGMYFASLLNNDFSFLMQKGNSPLINKEAKYMPYAAVAPINGAPRTCIVLIALTTSSKVLNEIILNSNGSKV